MRLTVFLCIFSIPLFACASKTAASQSAQSTTEKIWISKPDGSKQCGMAKGLDSKSGAAELTKLGITVFQSRKSQDGLMHMAMCGSATGDTIELQIPKSQLDIAERNGYHSLPKGPQK